MAFKFTRIRTIKRNSQKTERKVNLFFVILAGLFFIFSLLTLLLVSQLPNIDYLKNYEFDLLSQ